MVKPKMGLFAKQEMLKPKSPGVPALDWKKLIKFCRMKIGQFEQYGKKFNTPEGQFFFKDNGADILAVVHLDTVMGPLHTQTCKLSDDTIFFCPTLDDRAGAYAVLDYLPQAGINFDVLLTTGEEKMRSTARYFNPQKKYKYMFSFDRHGIDAVMYRYENAACIKLLKEAGWTTGTGTYSDIVDLEHLKCKGFNFGVGYYGEHTTRCYLSKTHFLENMRKFITFHKNNVGINLHHTPVWNTYTKEDGFGYLYTVGTSAYQDTFSDQDIEVLEALEKQGYKFTTKVTPENISEIVNDFQIDVREKMKATKNLNNVEKARRAQVVLDFKEITSEVKPLRAPIKSKKITKITPLRLISMEKSIIVGSEDSPQYGINKARKPDEQVFDNRDPLESSVVVHGGLDGERGLTNVMKTANDLGIAAIMLDVCTQCHKTYEFDVDGKSTHCPECRQKEVLMSDVEEVIVKQKPKILIHLPLQIIDKVKYGKDTYKQNDKGIWQWCSTHKGQKPEGRKAIAV